jgi:hypothetical protein
MSDPTVAETTIPVDDEGNPLWGVLSTYTYDEWMALDAELEANRDLFYQHWGAGIPLQKMDRATLDGRLKAAVDSHLPEAPPPPPAPPLA